MSDGSAQNSAPASSAGTASFDRTAGAQRWGEGGPEREKSRSLKPLMRLMPYIRRQQTTAVLAIIFLFVAAALNLAITFPVQWLGNNAFQTFDPMAKYGAKLQVADVVAVSVVRELGPLITAIILAGRSGSAFAAEIGTMKVTQELDALRTFGIDPVRFLVIPRLIATTIVTPMLAIWASILGVAGGYMILAPEGFTLAQYADEVRQAVTVGGFVQGLVKAAVFAILVASIGCLSGLRTGQGPGAVGLSTTRAVVAGIVAIILADSVLGAGCTRTHKLHAADSLGHL
jgi:ABC transport permease subunit